MDKTRPLTLTEHVRRAADWPVTVAVSAHPDTLTGAKVQPAAALAATMAEDINNGDRAAALGDLLTSALQCHAHKLPGELVLALDAALLILARIAASRSGGLDL